MDKEFRELYLLFGMADCEITAKKASHYTKRILDAGYRKADEVRKDTAKELLLATKRKISQLVFSGYLDNVTAQRIKRFLFTKAVEHGVEVDE